MKKVSIGILGYNEEYGIAHLLNSLQLQTLLQQAYALEIIVISNGSQDQMAAMARAKLAEFDQLKNPIKSQVIELPIADKCAAWNHFIHQAADVADYYICLDADVVLVQPTGLEELLQTLITHLECRICGGKVLNKRGEITNHHFIDGKCYAIRGEIARNIYIPNGVIADDVYVAATALTNWYETTPEVGEAKGYTRLTEKPVVRSGETPRDRDKSYWIACRKRTIMAEYAQRRLDYCMRSIFGGGDLAKTMVLKLATTHPNWFLAYLHQVSRSDFAPQFNPPHLKPPISIYQVAQFLVYCYCYLLSVLGIRNEEFGHLAWKLKHRYW
ncbi:glycosyltransferase family A protein [Leptolyngbya sp. 7M]|uniref:glycosyltransferase family A protein n=1 Tax=Leptolyngbya sp. 7M TaxID=2812896 RepID=UPI001B8B3A52|nr:glycosyltransferase family A protein [Leptolyngbya sp. 7M]QYO67978.1 glycosyltransferase family 2 protein [Leptolyngbya sp. 7M]